MAITGPNINEQISVETQDISVASKYPPKVFIKFKGKNSNLTVDKLDRQCLNPVIKINIINKKTINVMCLQT